MPLLPPNILCAVGLIAAMYAVQSVGVREAAALCNIGTVIEIGTLLTVIILGAAVYLRDSDSDGATASSATDVAGTPWPAFTDTTTATVLCVFAFGGLPQGLDFASEMKARSLSPGKSPLAFPPLFFSPVFSHTCAGPAFLLAFLLAFLACFFSPVSHFVSGPTAQRRAVGAE